MNLLCRSCLANTNWQLTTTHSGGNEMESATIIRIVAGVLFVVVLGIIISRRKAKNA
jgi:hypothetical protein